MLRSIISVSVCLPIDASYNEADSFPDSFFKEASDIQFSSDGPASSSSPTSRASSPGPADEASLDATKATSFVWGRETKAIPEGGIASKRRPVSSKLAEYVQRNAVAGPPRSQSAPAVATEAPAGAVEPAVEVTEIKPEV
jgi:hypothetical protein